MNLKAFVELVKETFSEWSKDKASRLAAALAYYTTFSLAPLLIIIIAVVGLVIGGQQDVQGQIIRQLEGLIGENGAALIQTMIENREPAESILATVIGVVTLLVGATGVFVALQGSLNTIWNVQAESGGGVLGMLKSRVLSFAMVLAVGFLLIVSLAVSAALAALTSFLGDMLPEIINLGWILDLVISFGVITLLFALIYKFLPDVEIAWGDVWIGAAVTSLLFTIGKFLIGLYLGNSSVASVYGAAGSLAVLLIWIYYSAQILFFGAEFTQVYAKRRGSRIVLSEEAVAMTAEQRAEQGLAPAGGEEWATAEPGRPLVQRPVPQPPAHLAPAHNPLRRDVRRLKRERWAAVGLGLLAGLMVTRITQK